MVGYSQVAASRRIGERPYWTSPVFGSGRVELLDVVTLSVQVMLTPGGLGI